MKARILIGLLVVSAACGTAGSGGTSGAAPDVQLSDAAEDSTDSAGSGDGAGKSDTIVPDVAAADSAGDSATGDLPQLDTTNKDGQAADSGDTTPAAPAIALADLASATAEELCKANFTTCTAEEKMPYATQAGCVAAVGAADAADFAELAKLVAAGKLTYDGQAAADCLAQAKMHCDDLDFVDGPVVCTKVFVGKAAPGSPCKFNVECASDFCPSSDTCPGVCTKRKALGASCGDADKCEPGAVCSGGVCVADIAKGAGAACNPLKCQKGLYCTSKEKCAPLVKLGGACDIVGACEPGAQCIDTGSGGVCKPMPKDGEACSPDVLSDAATQCATGLVCFNDGSEVGTCTPKVPIGGTCTNTSHCGGWDVHCVGPEGAKTCQLLSGKGGPCQAGDFTFGEWAGCLEPYTCAKGVCADIPGLGQPCADDLLKACADDLMCDIFNNVCIAMPGLGETCYGVCKTGLECDTAVEPSICKPAKCP